MPNLYKKLLKINNFKYLTCSPIQIYEAHLISKETNYKEFLC